MRTRTTLVASGMAFNTIHAMGLTFYEEVNRVVQEGPNAARCRPDPVFHIPSADAQEPPPNTDIGCDPNLPHLCAFWSGRGVGEPPPAHVTPRSPPAPGPRDAPPGCPARPPGSPSPR
jgi:hypothetical protein